MQTPQNRCVKSHASRGSRPFRISSIPRNIWPDDQAFFTWPPSTSTSTRRWPSMRVTGSTTIRLDIRAPYARAGRAGASAPGADRIGKYLTRTTYRMTSSATTPRVTIISAKLGKYEKRAPGRNATM